MITLDQAKNLKHSLYSYDYLTEHDLDVVCLDEQEAEGQE